MLQCKGYFSYHGHIIEIPNGGNSRNWVVNVVLQFNDDPTVNEPEIVIFLRQIRWPTEKKEGFGRREKNEIVRQRRLRSQSGN